MLKSGTENNPGDIRVVTSYCTMVEKTGVGAGGDIKPFSCWSEILATSVISLSLLHCTNRYAKVKDRQH